MSNCKNLLIVIFIAVLVSGCATFQSSKKINLAPFAENAVSIVSEIEYGLSKAKAVHTRRFLEGPAVMTYKQTWQKLGRFLRGIVAYSVHVVTISQSDLKDNEKANLLADYLEALSETIYNEPGLGFKMTQEEFSNAMNNIRNAETYFDAMQGAQPVVDEVARVAREVIDDLKNSQDNARIEVSDKIEKEHAPVLSFRQDVKATQARTFKTLQYGIRYSFGENSVVDSILIYDPQLKTYLKPGEVLTQEIMSSIEQRIIFRLEIIKKIQEQLIPELEQYQNEMKELDDLISIADRGISQSKAAIGVWRQSHQTMAAGITEPAAIDLFGIAKAAVKKVAPIP